MFLNAKTEKELDMLVQQNAQIGSALDKLERISSDKKLAHQLIMREKAERDYNSGMVSAERRGMQKGIQQGMQKGIQQGMQQEKISMAKSMKQSNMSIADIAKFTGLSEIEIKKL